MHVTARALAERLDEWLEFQDPKVLGSLKMIDRCVQSMRQYWYQWLGCQIEIHRQTAAAATAPPPEAA